MTVILIIGGAGFIGSVLVDYFLKKGHEVICIDLLRRGSNGIYHHKTNPNFTLYNTDYMNEMLGILLQHHQPDVVIHLAGIVGDPACETEPKLATRTNVEGIYQLVEECNKYDLKLFLASTCSVYGSNEKTCSENSLLNPLSHYAWTKIKMEEIVRKESKNGICFRFGTMYGWSPNMRYDIVVNRLVRDGLKFGTFNVFDGTQYRPFLHPLDLAIFFESLINKDLASFTGEVFNLVSENLSMLELGELIERTIPTIMMNLVPEKEDNRSYICRAFKANSRLGFSPRIRVRDGIQEIERNLLKIKEKKEIRLGNLI